MPKLVSLIGILVLLFVMQSCTYTYLHNFELKIAVIDSKGFPESALINSDAISTVAYPSYDKFIHENVPYKLPIFSVRGKNNYLKITNQPTTTYLIDSKNIDISKQFYINDDTISLEGTVKATDNIYYIDYFGKRELKNGFLKINVPDSIYTLYFPQYKKSFLIKDGIVSTLPSYDWSIKLYMDDGGTLKDALIQDLTEIKHNYYNPDKSSVIAYTDFVGDSYHTYKFLRDQRFEIKSGLTKDSHDWQNLKRFIDIPINAKHRALFLWDHGDSWVYHGNKALFQDAGYFMNLTGLASALKETHFDLLAFDMCLMGSVEVLYQIKDFSDYVLFSESTIPSYGFDYENLLSGNYTPEYFAKYISKRYFDSYNGKQSLTGINTEYCSNFFSDLNTLAASLTSLASSDNNFAKYIKNNIETIESYPLYVGYQVDLMNLLNLILKYKNIGYNIANQINNLKNDFEKMIVGDSDKMGIAFVKDTGYFDFDNYEHCTFARDSQWNNFLKILSKEF